MRHQSHLKYAFEFEDKVVLVRDRAVARRVRHELRVTCEAGGVEARRGSRGAARARAEPCLESSRFIQRWSGALKRTTDLSQEPEMQKGHLGDAPGGLRDDSR